MLKSQFGVRAVSFLGRTIPPGVGYRIADRVAGWVATRQQSGLIRAIRTNQWVVRGAGPGKEELDQVVLETLKNIAHSLYSLHHYIHDPTTTRSLVDLNPVARGLVERPEFSGRGLMLVGLHLSSFDLILQSMALQGLKTFVLTIPDPQNGRRLEFEMRKRTGMHLVPASISGLKQARNHLEAGGVVLTGIDRPVADGKVRPRFFGYPASLPVHHVYLAMKTRVPVMIVSARTGKDGQYQVTTSEPIEMEATSNREQDMLHNAERVLKEAERFISQSPAQWSISLPVWPELLECVPS